MNRFPKAKAIKRPFDYANSDQVGSDYLAKKFKRIAAEQKRQQVEQEAAEQAAHKKVRQLRKTA